MQKFRRIAIIGGGKTGLETAKIIFLLQHLTPTVCNGKKSKINLFLPKEIGTSDFLRKLENTELLTVKIFHNKTERNFNSITDALKVLAHENIGLAKILLTDMEHVNGPDSWVFLFGKTTGDVLSDTDKKWNKDIVDYQEEITDLLLPRLRTFIDRTEEFKKDAIKRNILDDKGKLISDAPIFITLKNEADNNIIRPIAHITEKVDILLHRRDKEGGNYISAGEKGEKYMPAILEALRKKELSLNETSSGLWQKNFKVIHTGHGYKTLIKFEEIVKIILGVIKSSIIKATVKGNEMPANETKHNGSVPHNDTAMAQAPVIALEREELAQVG